MTVKVVTDSTADLSESTVQELGITVVPVYVRFGEAIYRDGVDISHDEFYQRLQESPVHPSTSQPAPADFADTYRKLSKEADAVVSIQVTSKLSGTYNSALQGKEMTDTKCPIEVVDSRSLSMGLGLIAIAAARVARAEAGLAEVIEEVRQAVTHVRVLGVLDSLKYLLQGGRIGKAKALLGGLLNVKPMLTMRDGELSPVGLARTRAKGMERLYELAKNALNIQELAIVHSTTPEEANSLKERVASFLDLKRIHLCRLGPALGVYGGPGAIILALREKTGDFS
ncbi:DegV family protein [Chloroflexota bacterium]